MKYFLILLAVFVWSCSSKKSTTDAHTNHSGDSTHQVGEVPGIDPGASSIKVQALDSILLSDTKVFLLDVRTPEEVADGQIRNSALQIDILQEGFENRVAELDKEATYFVYCKAGGRSSRAQSIMQSMGFSHVVNVEGGITAWTQAGHSLELP